MIRPRMLPARMYVVARSLPGSPSMSLWLPVALALLVAPAPAYAQLRPLPPFDWRSFETDRVVTIQTGTGIYAGQRASLAGTEGLLVEAGEVEAYWRQGRVVIELGGTALRIFHDEHRFAPPQRDVDDPDAGRRTDAGDLRIGTAIRVSPRHWPADLALRFGTRLPTTDNRVGLERDQTDFYATIAAAVTTGRLRLSGETGVGIWGTRIEDFEQADVLLYALGAEYRAGPVAAAVLLVGQADGFDGWEIRGNENLREARLALLIGQRRWLRAELVRGLAPFSPDTGVRLSAGIAAGGPRHPPAP